MDKSVFSCELAGNWWAFCSRWTDYQYPRWSLRRLILNPKLHHSIQLSQQFMLWHPSINLIIEVLIDLLHTCNIHQIFALKRI